MREDVQERAERRMPAPLVDDGGASRVNGVDSPSLLLGVVVAPGLAEDVTAKVALDLAEDLRNSYGAVDWQTELVVDRLVAGPAPVSEIFDAARAKLLAADWDLAVVVTDLPLNVRRHAVSSRIGPTHGIAIVSLPALGPIKLRRRLHRVLVELVGGLVGAEDEHAGGGGWLARLRRGWGRRALQELATDEADRSPLHPAAFFGQIRLLLGMVRANRPWRLAVRLYGALLAALVAGTYGVVTSDIWRLSAAMGSLRLAAICAVSIAVTIVAIIAAHELWERAPDERVREQVVLFNLATALTVAIGIVTLYVALFVLIFACAGLLITGPLLGKAIGHPADVADYAVLAWFVASLATIGGALGAGLESDEAVREAAYASWARDEESEA